MSRRRLLLEAARPPSARHRYGSHRSQRADLHVPLGKGPHPVAIVIHGGYWQAKYGKRVTRPLAHDLARRGWAAWNIEYRRGGRRQGGGWPTTFDDVAAAIDQLAELDAALDLDRVIAVGHSAGGQLALWAAARPQLSDGLPGASPAVRVGRVAAMAPVVDLVKTYRSLRGGIVQTLMGGSVEEHPDRYDAFDPVRRAPLPVPVLIVHPTHDRTVPVQRSRDYTHVAREAGGETELVESPGGHLAALDPRSEIWARVTDWL